jgi:hypothetical protein
MRTTYPVVRPACVLFLLTYSTWAFAQETQRESSCYGQLVAAKEAVEAGDLARLRDVLTQLMRSEGFSREAAVRFLRREADLDTQAYDRSQRRGIADLYAMLFRKLGQSGASESVPALVGCLAGRNPVLLDRWSDCVRALVELSSRVRVRREDLRPVLESPDAKLAALGQQLWHCIAYERQHVGSDPKSVLQGSPAIKEGLQRRAGHLDNWRQLAVERGFDVAGEKTQSKLLALIADCRRRREESQAALRKRELGYQETSIRCSREALLQILALEELARTTGRDAFDELVNLLETGGAELQSTVAYHLYAMTGEHFPLTGYVDYGRYRTSVDLARKAAAAWRSWKAQHGDAGLPEPDQAEIARQRRLAGFPLDSQRQERTGEFARPTPEVIQELLASDDKQLIEVLSQVLASRALAEGQVARIIEAAKVDRLEVRRQCLWQVLYASRSPAAGEYLATVMNAGSDPGVVLAFLRSVRALDVARVPFLATLYGAHPSAEVKEATLRLVTDPGILRHGRGNEAGREALAERIFRHAHSDRHRAAALRAVYARAGVNRKGRAMVEELLREETTSGLRQEVYRMVLERSPERWIVRLLREERGEEVRLSGLRTYVQKMTKHPKPYRSYSNDMIAALRLAGTNDPSTKVRAAAKNALTLLQKNASDQLLGEFRKRLSHVERLAALSARREPALRERQQYESMLRLLESETYVERELGRLRSKFGVLPEEDQLRTDLQSLVGKQRTVLEGLLGETEGP